jgi:hypothetical protein
MLLYTLTKRFIEVQGKMLNAFGIILFYKVVGWFDNQDISVEPRRPMFNPFTNIYYVEYIYIFIYISCTCFFLDGGSNVPYVVIDFLDFTNFFINIIISFHAMSNLFF